LSSAPLLPSLCRGYTYWKNAGLDSNGTLPQWLAALGYNTYYTGKLFVEYTAMNRYPPPAGWTDIDALIYPNTFLYYNPAFSRNGEDRAAAAG
jgi:arylsulfatase A-like enzyme